MKEKSLFVLLLLGLFVHLNSTKAYAVFLINLKNGRTISAESYQVEGNRIVLYLGSGTVKVSMREVQSVLETREKIREESKEEAKGEKKDLRENLDEEKAVKEPAIAKEDIAPYLKRKVEIGGRLEEAKQAYFHATGKYEKERAREMMISISKELFSLQEEVQARNSGILPNWWKEK